ncbi:MAG TPA: type II CAAX endopeptidase family protein [Steroidobacteraceae bacterium]
MRLLWVRAFGSLFNRLLIGIVLVVTPVIVMRGVIGALHIYHARAIALVALEGALLSLLGYWYFVRRIERRSVTELSAAGALGELALGWLVGAALFAAVLLALALLGVYHYTSSAPAAVLIEPLMASVAAGIFEELLFRGLLFRLIEGAVGSWLSLVISAVIFGLLHLVNPDATLLGACAVMLEGGVLLAGAYLVTRRLWLPIGMHIAWNFTQGGIFGLVVSGTGVSIGLFNGVLSGPVWLSGGKFGAEASVVAVIICLIAAVGFLAIAVRRRHILPARWQQAS